MYVTSYLLGRLIIAKLHLTQSADAAAYSGAVVQARAFNAHAYLNRAQLAHQIATAHWVTLGASVNFASTQAQRSIMRNPPAWLIGTMFGFEHANSYLSAQKLMSLQTAWPIIAQQHEHHDRLVNQIISNQRQSLIDRLGQTRQEVIKEVLKKSLQSNESNTQDGSLDEFRIIDEVWDDEIRDAVATSETVDDTWRSLLGGAVSKFGYLGSRNKTQRNWLLPNLKCPMLRPKLRRRGTTIFDENGQWQARDTLSYHAIKFNKLIGCYEREYPMGWGFVQNFKGLAKPSTTAVAPSNFSKQPFWRWFKAFVQLDGISWFSSKNSLADAWADQATKQMRTSGVAKFARLNSTSQRSFRFRLIVKQRGLSIFGIPVELVAQASAETYFDPPDLTRLDAAKDTPHLFHAFWHAKLSPN